MNDTKEDVPERAVDVSQPPKDEEYQSALNCTTCKEVGDR